MINEMHPWLTVYLSVLEFTETCFCWQENEDEDVDPLEAYMANVNEEVRH